jgi:hypothetical protein
VAVIATLDEYVTAPRLIKLNIQPPLLPNKTVNGQTYFAIWNGYTIPAVNIYRYDIRPISAASSGDPHLLTFDGVSYSTYAIGEFIYVNTTIGGINTQVNVRHTRCGPTASCVCGVAMQEGATRLVVDRCKPGDVPHFFWINNKDFYNTSGTFADASGTAFKLQMPSGSKVI